MNVVRFDDGLLIEGDCTDPDTYELVKEEVGNVPLIATDPPYGKIVKQRWDKTDKSAQRFASWMIDWTNQWSNLLHENAAFYVWGGVGIPNFRPFFHYLANVEQETNLKLANLITWNKKRAYGVQHNYLFTREECAYLFNGADIKKPRCFNVPLLDIKRGYAGYSKKYPAKSEYKRRTNVWTDITEIFQGKRHPTQKARKLYEVMIEVHTEPGEYVVDIFAGAGTCADACRRLGRKFVLIENDPESIAEIKRLLSVEHKENK